MWVVRENKRNAPLTSSRTTSTDAEGSQELTQPSTEGEGRKQPIATKSALVLFKHLPIPPTMHNLDPDKGPIAYFRVFGFALEWKQLRSAAARLGYDDPHNNGAERVWHELKAQSVPWCKRHSFVDADWLASISPCLVLATNKTEKDLENAQNLDAINHVRAVLGAIGIKRMPTWFRPSFW